MSPQVSACIYVGVPYLCVHFPAAYVRDGGPWGSGSAVGPSAVWDDSTATPGGCGVLVGCPSCDRAARAKAAFMTVLKNSVSVWA